MITAFRIVKERFVQGAFSGTGARQFGGRWNPTGFAAVYTAESLALTILEILVHLEDENLLFQRFVKIPVSFDPALVWELPAIRLPENWDALPICEATQDIGRQWLQKAEHPILKVPSAITKSESNYVINPFHPDFKKMKIGEPQHFEFDRRLLEKSTTSH